MQAKLAISALEAIFDRQTAVIDQAQAEDRKLVEVLEENGLTYDDLIYEDSHSLRWNGASHSTLDEFEPVSGLPDIVSFFTGCGGADLGFEAVGHNHAAVFEINEIFCKTLRKNRPSWKVFGPPTHSGDVSKFDEIAETLTRILPKNFDGIFIGGPPCQPFSIAANQRFAKTGENFKRVGFAHERNGNLLFDFVSLIEEFKPKAFLVENVPGLRDIDDGAQLEIAISRLRNAGYYIDEPLILNAANFGIAQFRSRLFIVGARKNKAFRPPKISNFQAGCGSVLSESVRGLPNDETRIHQAGSILRYRTLPYGGRDQLGRVDRLDPSKPSKTVIAGGLNGGGRSHLHPEIPRTLSVRECARLQSFPDDYIFVGPTARQFTQVGNAVPPVLAAKMALAIQDSYY